MFLFSLTLCNISLSFTRSVQLTFSSLLQHNISKLPRYFGSTRRSAQLLTVIRIAWYCLYKDGPCKCVIPYSKDNHISVTAVRTTFFTGNAIKQATLSLFTFFWNMKSYGLAILPEVSKKCAVSLFRNVLSVRQTTFQRFRCTY
jgi:hypothetical protein